MLLPASSAMAPHCSSLWNLFLRQNLRLGPRRDVRLAAWLLGALATSFLAYVARMHEITHDAFHEMSLFREALVSGRFPTQDVFAFTPTVNPSVHHEWGTGAVLYFATVGSGLGLAGLSLLKLLLMGTLWLLLYRVARMRGAHPYIFACSALVVFPVLWVGFATVRAQLFTLVFVAAQCWMLELDWRGKRWWILAWLPMLVLWLNLHAGFVVGLGLIAFHSIERAIASLSTKRRWQSVISDNWHLILVAPVAVACLQLNPYGWEYIPYLIRAIGMPRPLIREWQPLWYTYAPGVTILLFGTSVGLFVYAQRHNRLRRLRGAAFVALCTYMTIKHIRHGSIFAVMWLAYVPAWISRTKPAKALIQTIEDHRTATIRICQLIIMSTLIYASAHHFWRPSLPPKQLYSTACFPTAAVDYLKTHNFHGNLITPFHVGAYVSWEMHPAVKVSFDGRYEVAYQEQVMPEHNQFLSGEGEWWRLLDKYPSDAALIHRQAPVSKLLDVFRKGNEAIAVPPTKEAWELVYEDDSFVIIAAQRLHLPHRDLTGKVLPDGAWQAFTREHAHWDRHAARILANRHIHHCDGTND